jgi:hypothetical protein
MYDPPSYGRAEPEAKHLAKVSDIGNALLGIRGHDGWE